MATATPSEKVRQAVTAWDGVQAGPGRRGEFSFKLDHRELGHLHGDHAAHFFFPREVWAALKAEGRITAHPVFPDKVGPAARRIGSEADVQDVIELMRLNYERISARMAA